MSILQHSKRFIAALVFACIVKTPLANAALLSLQPNVTYAGNGDSVSLDLVISELGNFSPDSLGAFDVWVGFDAAVLSFADYSLGSFLGDLNLFTALDLSAGDTGGAVNVAEVSLLSSANLHALQPGAFLLASLRFNVTGLADGSATRLSISPGAVLANAAGTALPFKTGTPASITSVPLPGTLLLILAGLLGACVTGRMRTRSS